MSLFDGDTFLVREHIGVFKLHEAFDILSPEGRQIGLVIERASGLKKFLKLLVNKQLLPCDLEVLSEGENGNVLLKIHRGPAIFRTKVTVSDANGQLVGYFKKRILSLGGSFDVYDASDKQIALLQGDWKGWNFKFSKTDGVEFGQVSKKWAGIAQELFTNADNYVVHFERDKMDAPEHFPLVLAAAICIDTVLKDDK